MADIWSSSLHFEAEDDDIMGDDGDSDDEVLRLEEALLHTFNPTREENQTLPLYKKKPVDLMTSEFEVQPIGHIGEYPKRIPYKSEKKTVQQKTGMDGFEGKCFHLKTIRIEEKLIHGRQSTSMPSRCRTILETRMHIL